MPDIDCSCLDHVLGSLHNCEKWISTVYKLPGIQYLVLVTWKNGGIFFSLPHLSKFFPAVKTQQSSFLMHNPTSWDGRGEKDSSDDTFIKYWVENIIFGESEWHLSFLGDANLCSKRDRLDSWDIWTRCEAPVFSLLSWSKWWASCPFTRDASRTRP